MDKFQMNQLYDCMSPRGATSMGDVQKENPFRVIEELLMGDVKMYSFEDIKKQAKDKLKKIKSNVQDDPDLMHLHGVGNDGLLFENDKYFSSVKSSKNFLPSDLQDNKLLSVFATRNPFISTARRATSDVDLFLNYTPSYFASQLVPYLDVEMQIVRPPVASPEGSPTPATNISTPSMMRFLMGSVPYSDPKLGVAGRALETGQASPKYGKDDKIDTFISYAGMEMFLAPQTLTNMDELQGGNGRRLVDVKPFVPFASIEGMEISFANAGAGAMVHKKGTLRFKIHDKARIAEMAPFLKPGGFAYVNIITTYGWIAPDRGDEDVYSKFINEKMMSQDVWMVANSSYSFDASGQVSVILELVSQGYRKLQSAEILAPAKIAERLKAFDALVEKIQKVATAVQSKVPVADLKVVQTLSGITGRSLPDLSTLGNSVDQLVKKFSGKESQYNLEPDAFKELKQNVSQLIQSTKPQAGSKLPTIKQQLDADAKQAAKEAFAPVMQNVDPFLPTGKSSDVIEKKYSKLYIDLLKSAITPSYDDVVTSGPGRNIVSFGSVFSKIAGEAVLRQDTCDELQIIFYSLNDSCGPVSGQSIAEFPLDATRLEYEYAELLKQNGKVTLEMFLRTIIDTQVTDKRAVAYNMTAAYEKWSPEKQQITNDNKNYDNAMLEWTARYGSFTQPMIEMFVESGVEGKASDGLKRLSVQHKDKSSSQGSTRIIKRIHIYDVNCTPFDGLRKIIRVGDSFVFGDVKTDTELVTNSDWFGDYLKNKEMALRQLSDKSNADQLLAVVNPVPGYKTYSVKSNSRDLMQHVSSFAPCIRIGANGTLVINASIASKTSGLGSAINIIRQNAAYSGQGGVLPPANGLEDPNGMPLRMAPAQLSMQTLGCPLASAYQQYFVDLGTGTTLDNLYTCTSVKHTLSPGKFTSDWTFMYTDAYGKFAGAPSIVAAATKLVQKIAEEAESSAKNKKAESNLGQTGKKPTPPASPPRMTR